MSSHTFEGQYNGRPVEIMMGWDRPLQGFFLVVDYLDHRDDDPDEPIYSNLNDEKLLPRGNAPDLSHYRGVLARLGLSVPETMIEEVIEDGLNNVGNRDVHHSI